MPILFPNGFIINSNESIDSRLILTKQQMKNISFSKTPDIYFCICSEDKNLYIFDSSIPVEEEDPETGCYKLASCYDYEKLKNIPKVKVGNTELDITSVIELAAGNNVSLGVDGKKITINSTGGGSSSTANVTFRQGTIPEKRTDGTSLLKGDLWFCTADISETEYKANKWYRYNENGTWDILVDGTLTEVNNWKSSFEVTPSEIKSSVTQTATLTDIVGESDEAGLRKQVKTNTSEIEQHSTDINLRVTTKTFNEKTEQIDENVSEVKLTADSVSSEVKDAKGTYSTLKQKIDSIEVSAAGGNIIFKQDDAPTKRSGDKSLIIGDLWFCTKVYAEGETVVYKTNKWYRYNGKTTTEPSTDIWDVLTDGELATLNSWKSEFTMTPGAIEQKVTKTEEAVGDENSGLIHDVAVNTASITTEAEKIALVVEKTSSGNVIKAASIVTAINDTGSEVKIAADKITLDGNVVMKSNLTDKTTTISGDNITTGTVSADRIDADNLTVKAANIAEKIEVKDSSSNIIFKADASTKATTIGGFTVNDTALYNGPSSKTVYSEKGVYVGTDGIHITDGGGAADAKFVTLDNSGKITANFGDIAGFKFGVDQTYDGKTYSGANRFYKPNTGDDIFDGVGLYNGTGWLVDDNGQGKEPEEGKTYHSVMFYAGANVDPRNGKFKVTKDGWIFIGGVTGVSKAKFKVDPDGNFVATNATISGNLNTDSLEISDGTNTSILTSSDFTVSNAKIGNLNAINKIIFSGKSSIRERANYTAYFYKVTSCTKVGTTDNFTVTAKCFDSSGNEVASPEDFTTSELAVNFTLMSSLYPKNIGEITFAKNSSSATKTFTVENSRIYSIDEKIQLSNTVKNLVLNGTATLAISANGNIETTGSLLPAVSSTYDLGSSTYKWKDLYLSGAVQTDLTINSEKKLIGKLDCPTINSSGSVQTAGKISIVKISQDDYSKLTTKDPEIMYLVF